MNDYVDYVFGPTQGQLALTEKAMVSEQGLSFSSVFIDIDLRYPISSNGMWTISQLESALLLYIDVLYKHVDIASLGTEQRLWIMTCRDHPFVNTKHGVDINKKNGIHAFFPDIALDRRKLREIRMESLEMGDFFLGCENTNEDLFDEGVYKVEMLRVKLKFSLLIPLHI